jgi:alkanesulfonate monooxygenase SsuD/methylene tetrahydromethanopterin reductase-like flavin-dependent oxidoreductase (luciferase family)
VGYRLDRGGERDGAQRLSELAGLVFGQGAQEEPFCLSSRVGDRVLRVVAEHADVWNYPGEPSAEFRRKNQVLNEHCAAIGRDPGDITRSMQTVVRCDDPREPAATRALLLEMISAGVTHIVLAAILGGRPVQWLADQIIEPVLAEARPR